MRLRKNKSEENIATFEEQKIIDNLILNIEKADSLEYDLDSATAKVGKNQVRAFNMENGRIREISIGRNDIGNYKTLELMNAIKSEKRKRDYERINFAFDKPLSEKNRNNNYCSSCGQVLSNGKCTTCGAPQR